MCLSNIISVLRGILSASSSKNRGVRSVGSKAFSIFDFSKNHWVVYNVQPKNEFSEDSLLEDSFPKKMSSKRESFDE